jgi:hypothetical protein
MRKLFRQFEDRYGFPGDGKDLKPGATSVDLRRKLRGSKR